MVGKRSEGGEGAADVPLAAISLYCLKYETGFNCSRACETWLLQLANAELNATLLAAFLHLNPTIHDNDGVRCLNRSMNKLLPSSSIKVTVDMDLVPVDLRHSTERDEQMSSIGETNPTAPKVCLKIPKPKKKTSRRTESSILSESQEKLREWEQNDGVDDDANDMEHDSNVRKSPLVIPALEDTFKKQSAPRETTKTIDDNDEDLKAAQALQDEAIAGTRMSNDSGRPIIPQSQTSSAVISNIQNGNDHETMETQQYKNQLDSLPSELPLDEYKNRVPIADFGAALLRGMGWKEDNEGKKSKNEESEPIMPRPHRLGLGATPRMEARPESTGRRRPLRPDQLERQERLLAQQKAYEQQRQEKLKFDKQQTLQNGSLIWIMTQDGNRTRRARAKVIQLVGVPGLNRVKVQVEGDVEPTVIKRSEMDGLLTRKELEESPFQYTELETKELRKNDDRYGGGNERKKDRDGDRHKVSRNENRGESRHHEEHSSHRPESSKRQKNENERSREHDAARSKKRRRTEDNFDAVPSWLLTNIRVRIVTEKWGRRYFKEKGVVVDVTPKGATLRMVKDGSIVDCIPERYLETALPKPAGKVIVLAGPNRLAKGQLLERDSKTSTGVVQVYEDMSVIKLSLDDIAEWCGPLDDDLEE